MLASLCVLALAAGVAACGSDDDGGGGSGGGDKNVTVGYVSPVGAQPGQQDIAFGMKAAAEGLGWKTKVLDANLSPDAQVSNLDTLLNQQTSGVSTWALDPGSLSGVFSRANSEEVPVVGVNSPVPGVNTDVKWERYECEKGGSADKTAQYIAERQAKAKVLIVGSPPVPSLLKGIACFKKQAQAAGLEVVGQVDNVKDTSATAQPLVADMLTKNPDIQAIWAYNDSSALGASAAVVATGKEVWSGDKKGVMIFGGNADKEALEAIKQGRLTMTLDPNNVETGFAMVKAWAVPLEDDKPISDMPKEIIIDSTLYDADNIDEYIPPRERKITLDNLPIYQRPSS
jgi:ribose transport system substrate-binding protein